MATSAPHESKFRAVTLRDVARAAGVSTASASRALGEGGVTAGLRARIEAAAARLGYVPDLAARALATRRSGLIGLVVQDLADPLIANILAACERTLAESACGVVLVTTDGTPEGSARAIHDLLGRGVQALIFAEVRVIEPSARAATARGVPWISLAERPGASGAPGGTVGRRQGAILASRYLKSLGHRRFALFAPRDADTIAAVREVLTADSSSLEVLEAANLDAAPAAIGALLERDEPPTAVICGSDVQALAGLRECALRGVAVPQRLSLIGFGDAEFARRSSPALSTIRVSTAEVGVRLAQAVLARLNGEDLPVDDVPVKLIARESTGPLT
jgi:LacI family transcriptional regulator